MSGFWIEKGWGASIDNATFYDANSVIYEIRTKGEKHESFWIGYVNEEYVLEISKNLDLFLIYGQDMDKRLKVSLRDWEEVKYFIGIYFNKDFLLLKNKLNVLAQF